MLFYRTNAASSNASVQIYYHFLPVSTGDVNLPFYQLATLSAYQYIIQDYQEQLSLQKDKADDLCYQIKQAIIGLHQDKTTTSFNFFDQLKINIIEALSPHKNDLDSFQSKHLLQIFDSVLNWLNQLTNPEILRLNSTGYQAFNFANLPQLAKQYYYHNKINDESLLGIGGKDQQAIDQAPISYCIASLLVNYVLPKYIAQKVKIQKDESINQYRLSHFGSLFTRSLTNFFINKEHKGACKERLVTNNLILNFISMAQQEMQSSEAANTLLTY